MKKSAVILGLALSATIFSANAEKFKVCADPLNPPYSSNKEDGFENKIASLFAKELGQELEYFWLPQRIGFIRNSLNAFVDENAVESKEFKCDVVMGMPVESDMAQTTAPYYHSTYVLLIAKNRGFDDISDPWQLGQLPEKRKEKLKMAMFDRGAGTDWMQKHDLLEQGIPYQSMTGDAQQNVAMQISDDLKAKKIDAVILWGVLAGHVIAQNPKGYHVISMKSEAGVKFDYQMAMGVRKNDKIRKEQLDKLISKKSAEIETILSQYHIPLLPIETPPSKKD
jgi:quinoprotein dehydrogenase-associated probable ABC transporter substrate-binding protein